MKVVVTIDAPHLNGDDGTTHTEVSSLIAAVGFHSKLVQRDSGVLLDEVEGHRPMTVNWEIETES